MLNYLKIYSKVLVVGDYKTSIQPVCQYLENLNIQFSMAETSKDAIDIFRRILPDIVLCDDTLTATEISILLKNIHEISGNSDDTIFILLTHINNDAELIHILKNNISDIITLPINEIGFKFHLMAIQKQIKTSNMLNELKYKFIYTNQLIGTISSIH